VAESCRPEKSCTIVPTFVDANVLVYAQDRDAKAKHELLAT
jgi:predicted nucleic acid-binding protein